MTGFREVFIHDCRTTETTFGARACCNISLCMARARPGDGTLDEIALPIQPRPWQTCKLGSQNLPQLSIVRLTTAISSGLCILQSVNRKQRDIKQIVRLPLRERVLKSYSLLLILIPLPQTVLTQSCHHEQRSWEKRDPH